MRQVTQHPKRHFFQIWNMCFGFLGIQFAFGLQNANVSRIFQSLGASIDTIPLLWMAGPLTGLLVQPIVGHLSDRTWGRFGRRKPYFTVGAILTTGALLVMPNSPYLWFAAITLWVLDASINIAMEPFRAFVGDNLPESQRATGYLMQSFFIGIGAVIASCLPWLLTKAGVSNTSAPGQLPDSVIYAFYIGAAALLVSMMWTVFSSKEYSPEQLAAFAPLEQTHTSPLWLPSLKHMNLAFLLGLGSTFLIWLQKWDKQLLILSVGAVVYAVLLALCLAYQNSSRFRSSGLYQILADAHRMPPVMKQLAGVQFFSWLALFAMWIYTTLAVTSFHYQTSDTQSAIYNEGANWVGILFGVYNGVAALAAFGIALVANRIGRKKAHAVNLLCGSAGLISFYFIRDPNYLWVAMIGVGIAWASILSLPYAMLSIAVPAHRMGTYMGIFNLFIVIPQLIAVSTLGLIVKNVFEGQTILALVFGGLCFAIAAVFALFVKEHGDESTTVESKLPDTSPLFKKTEMSQ